MSKIRRIVLSNNQVTFIRYSRRQLKLRQMLISLNFQIKNLLINFEGHKTFDPRVVMLALTVSAFILAKQQTKYSIGSIIQHSIAKVLPKKKLNVRLMFIFVSSAVVIFKYLHWIRVTLQCFKRLGNVLFKENTWVIIKLTPTDWMERGVLKSTPPWRRNPHETPWSGRRSCTVRVSAGWYSRLDILPSANNWETPGYHFHYTEGIWYCLTDVWLIFCTRSLCCYLHQTSCCEKIVGGGLDIPMCLTIIQEKLEYTPTV